jgi:FtsP/CotA-like multicopper oxidase with cupredoxin domain
MKGFLNWIILFMFSGIPAYALEADITSAPDVPAFITRTMPETVEVHFEAEEFVGDLADGKRYKFWSFNGTVPGPMIRVRLGDTVEFHLSNHSSSQFPHNIDLHAVNGPGGGASVSLVAPGEERIFRFKTLHPGLYIYRCASPIPSIPAHVANGMYGLLLVEPKHGFPRVDREFYIFESEFYTQDSDPRFVFNISKPLPKDVSSVNKSADKHLSEPGVEKKTEEQLEKEMEEIEKAIAEKESKVFTAEEKAIAEEVSIQKLQGSIDKSINEDLDSYENRKHVLELSLEKGLINQPDYVVFNGRQGALLGANALKVNVGDKVRIFFGNIGPNGISSFHIGGEIFDRVYLEGAVNGIINKNVQTTLVPSGGAVIVEFTIDVPGDYLLVDHSIFRIDKGAIGMITAVGDSRPKIFESIK